jgi:urease accessory protein
MAMKATIMTTNTIETPFGGSPLLLLQVWLSPAFPVGSFAYSHGLEAAAEAGSVFDASSLREWIADLLRYGSAHNDAIFLAAAYRAAQEAHAGLLADINDLALALCASNERRLETSQLGAAFVTILRAAWPCATLDLLPEGAEIAYPVAFGAAAAGRALPLEATLEAFVLAFASALVSAALRCASIGQTDGQRTIADLGDEISACAAFAARSTIADLGGVALRSDIASMRHETQYSRMFRS